MGLESRNVRRRGTDACRGRSKSGRQTNIKFSDR